VAAKEVAACVEGEGAFVATVVAVLNGQFDEKRLAGAESWFWLWLWVLEVPDVGRLGEALEEVDGLEPEEEEDADNDGLTLKGGLRATFLADGRPFRPEPRA